MTATLRPLVLPQINTNGTSGDALVAQQVDVITSLRATIAAMVEASPHGRDYQLREAEYAPARTAWFDRCEVLSSLLNEIEAHALAISDANDAYKARRAPPDQSGKAVEWLNKEQNNG